MMKNCKVMKKNIIRSSQVPAIKKQYKSHQKTTLPTHNAEI